MARASDILAVAAKEIGTVESGKDKTKYGQAYGLDGVYWCMIFVWWVFQQVDKTLFYGGGKTASCTELMEWAKKQGKWITKDFQPGDVVIYEFGTAKNPQRHTGILESASGQYVVTIEGNTSSGNTGSQNNGGGVYRRKRKKTLILGAYRPDYEESYRSVLQRRAGLADATMDYLAKYKYADDLLRKLATMK